MKFLRNRFVSRTISVFLLLVFVQSLILPEYALALTSGPHQPEYTSYEDAGATDMVNLLTGDFNFNMPVLEVPGPEGNFALPLSYHAGIGTEQEASWVGLGWNINAGSIVRNINQYPDDASGEPNTITVKDLAGIRGYTKIYNHPFRETWNSQTGYYGNINLLDIVEVGFGNKTDVGIAGIHVGDNGVHFNAWQFASTVATVASFGSSSVATGIVSAAKQAAISTAVSFAMPLSTPSTSSAGYWGGYNKKSTSTSIEVNKKASLIATVFFQLGTPGPWVVNRKKSYHIWMDKTRSESMYGYLYSGDAPLETRLIGVRVNGGTINPVPYFRPSEVNTNPGAASDVNFVVNSATPYNLQNSPTLLASDDYLVNAPGVSGSITPYRLEVGSVAVPREMTSYHSRYAALPYLNNYKVPFIYEGSIFNRYFHHTGGETSVASPGFYYGLNLVMAGPFDYYFDLTDHVFSQRLKTSTDPLENIDALKKIPQGRHIEWLTNEDIKAGINSNTQDYQSKFLDFLKGTSDDNDFTHSDRYKFRSNYTLGANPFPTVYSTRVDNFSLTIPVSTEIYNQLNVTDAITLSLYSNVDGTYNGDVQTTVSSKSGSSITVDYTTAMQVYMNQDVEITLSFYKTPQLQKGIGGYCITATDGTTYHFALPVYDFDEFSEVVKVNDASKKSTFSRKSPFAQTWLLTSITGPDFIDRNKNGLADESDWGYWVKMNYGKHTDAYEWRNPYSGTMRDPDGQFVSYTKGKKQLYYLNSIETRSHVALFLKSSRQDGKSSGAAVFPLKLDEICLLKKEAYTKLTQAPYYQPDYSNQITAMCLSTQLAGAARDFVNKNCVKRVLFNYGYDLCQSTPNAGGSENPYGGKLTLKRITVKGRNDLSIVPDFKFQYGYNPGYTGNAWDRWGMYSSLGSYDNHATPQNGNGDGDAWSLTKIITPQGTELQVNYERDTYASISGAQVLDAPKFFERSNFSTAESTALRTLPISNDGTFQVGDRVRVSASVLGQCADNSYLSKSNSGDFIVAAAGSSSIMLDNDVVTTDCPPGDAQIEIFNGSVSKIMEHKRGGNLRVGSIVMRDETGRENKQRYIYTLDDGKSSGVISAEPGTASFQTPETPVMYGKVAVLNGKLTTDQDYYTKQVYEFLTPQSSDVSVQTQDMGTQTGVGQANETVYRKLFKIEDRSSRIGKLSSIKVYDKNGNITSQAALDYEDDELPNDGINNHQGIFTEGTLLMDFSIESPDPPARRVNRTTAVRYPYTLKKITNTKDGFTSETQTLSWDLVTGVALETLNKSPLGVYTKTVTKPAYKVYPELGFRALGWANKNMLSQVAATYVYRTDASGTPQGLISGEAQTWRQDWANYRYYNGTKYANDPQSQSQPVWRKGQAYEWKGKYSKLNISATLNQPKDGTQTFSAADEFNFSTGPTDLWQYTGEILRFDHFGMPVETKDMNYVRSAVKMGYGERTVIASAINARYREIAFSSAEDLFYPAQNKPYFGGEVALENGTVKYLSKGQTASTHTGDAVVAVSSGHSFVFRTDSLAAQKNYRASVWTNNTNGKIYYSVNGGGEIVPTNQTITSAVNGWYRIDVALPNQSSDYSLEIGVKSANGSEICFDDFRFQPVESVMTCYVYPPPDFEFTGSSATFSGFTYMLNNDNLFARFEHNERGVLIRTYNESITYGVKLISEYKDNYRRFTIPD